MSLDTDGARALGFGERLARELRDGLRVDVEGFAEETLGDDARFRHARHVASIASSSAATGARCCAIARARASRVPVFNVLASGSIARGSSSAEIASSTETPSAMLVATNACCHTLIART